MWFIYSHEITSPNLTQTETFFLFQLVLCQVGDNGFRNTFGDEQPLSDIHENEIVFAFETHPLSEMNDVNSSYEMIQILLVHIERFSSTKR